LAKKSWFAADLVVINCHMKRFLLLIAALATQASAATLTLNPVQDATLFEDTIGGLSGGGSDRIYVGRVGTNDPTPLRRGLLQFDLSAIPANATINSVRLTLQLLVVSNSNTASISLHPVTGAWTAGIRISPGGSGASANPGDATWLHRSSPTTWTTPGGDFLGLSSATTSVSAIGIYNWSTPGLATDVINWIANPASNAGWLLRGNEATAQSVKVFGSMEQATGTLRPVLEVDYTAIPEPQTALLSLAGLCWFVRRRRD
jgi:hypothetical protein